MAVDLNKVTLVTRLTRDAELKYTNSGFQITTFSGAVNSSKKDGDQWIEEANFFDFTILGKRGESLIQYLVKGQQVAIEGSLKQDRWEQDGQKRSRVTIKVDNIQLLGGNKDSNGGSQSNNNYNNQSNGQQSYNNNTGGFQGDDPNQDIPF